jgi:hypothetical protein
MAGKGQVANKPENGVPAVFNRMLERMELAAEMPDDFPNPMISGIVGILEADSPEEMWESDELAQIGGRNLRDVEQRIIEYTVRYSDNQEILSPFVAPSSGRKMYLLIRSMRYDTGEEFVWNTSAPLLVGKILWLADRGMLPADVVIRGINLGADQWVLKLRPMPQRVSQEAPF